MRSFSLLAGVVVAQAGKRAGEEAQEFPAFPGIFCAMQLVQRLGQFDEQDAAQISAGIFFAGRITSLAEFACGFDHFPPMLAAFAVHLPIDKAGVPPFGKVLMSDDTPAELFGHDLLHFRQIVQPVGDRCAEQAIFDFMVEFVPNGFGQTGDFAGSCFHRIFATETQNGISN